MKYASFNMLSFLVGGETIEKKRKKQDENEEFALSVQKALKDWEEASGFFNNVIDPDLIDQAIHLEDAAQKRYIYLIKKAKEKSIRSV